MLNNLFLENNFISILILVLLVIVSLLVSEVTKKKYPNTKNELLRKIPHIIIGVLFSITPMFLTKNEIIISSIILFFGIWIGKYLPFFKSVFSVKRISMGMWLMPVSLGILSWIWLPENKTPFIVGMLILGFSDAFAAIFGKIWGKKKIPFFKKTFLGSSTFFISSFIILYLFSKTTDYLKLISISLILTIVELIFIFGLDNLFIPIISSYLFYWFLM